ncbi:MAG: hypothetical protein MJ068_00370 [Clostridia bacterium]|nr:hypothetical protein [Clostridia bacterium]
MEQKKQRNFVVDLYKIVLAIFVIFIHFPNGSLSPDGNAFFRLAIAGFASITGFYIYKKNSSYEEKLKSAKKFLINSLKYFGIAAVFAFVAQLIYTWILGAPISEGLRSFAFEIAPFLHKTRPFLVVPTVFYQLWYLQGLVFVAGVYLLSVRLKIDNVMFVLPLLAIPLYWAQTKWPLTQNFDYQVLYRNSWFMILPSFAGGWIAGHFKETRFKWYVYPILILILGGFMFLQVIVNRHYPIEMTFIAVIVCSLIILLLDKIPKFSFKPFYWIFGEKFYVIIYFIHVFVGSLLRDKMSVNPCDESGLFILYTLVASVAINQLFNLIKLFIKIAKQN